MFLVMRIRYLKILGTFLDIRFYPDRINTIGRSTKCDERCYKNNGKKLFHIHIFIDISLYFFYCACKDMQKKHKFPFF